MSCFIIYCNRRAFNNTTQWGDTIDQSYTESRGHTKVLGVMKIQTHTHTTIHIIAMVMPETTCCCTMHVFERNEKRPLGGGKRLLYLCTCTFLILSTFFFYLSRLFSYILPSIWKRNLMIEFKLLL
jgi:hypothetical protein